MDAQELQKLKNRYDIIGNDALLNRALEMAVEVATTDLAVLVSGESGVGKENIPKIIHQNSRRKNGNYFAVNCGAIPEGTIDSELFGHEKGSFTGATESRKGYFEEANGGTLFLDEIGELPLASQAKLLRVLQSGEYIRVGSSKVGTTDVRVIAATNMDLRHAVAKGKFREDLYYRLNAIQIMMPSLRERKDDIYLLFRKFAADFAEKYTRQRITLSREAITLLINYRWPGNIRQLKNVAETVAALESGKQAGEVSAMTLASYLPKEDSSLLPVPFHDTTNSISEDEKQEIYRALYSLNAEVSELKKVLAALRGGAAPATVPAPAKEKLLGHPSVEWSKSGSTDSEDVDIQDGISEQEGEPQTTSLSIKGVNEDLIRKALERHQGNRKKAAEELGISERTLYRKLPEEYKKLK